MSNPRKWGTITFFSVFSRRCCQPPQESHVHDRNICLQLPIMDFLAVQHLDKFRFLNFDHTTVCVKYGKTLISYHYFFKAHLLFCTTRDHLNQDLVFHFNGFVLHWIGIFVWPWLICEASQRISVHGRVNFFISWKYPFFKKISNKFLTIYMSGSEVFFRFDGCHFFGV